ncbi:MAG: CAP domain-containing protein [Gammaproteobacteria bacterium]
MAVNNVRSKARMCGRKFFSAAPALDLNINLNKAAYKHSLDMYENQFLEHVSSNGNTLVERMQDANYSWNAVAENIAHNQKDIAHVIEDWLSSPGHCSNMMSADYTQTGVAQVNRYWTQVYAAPN